LNKTIGQTYITEIEECLYLGTEGVRYNVTITYNHAHCHGNIFPNKNACSLLLVADFIFINFSIAKLKGLISGDWRYVVVH
jgi:hypothetical protein